METEERDSLNEPTFSSTPKLVFRQPGDSRAYPRNRSNDKLPLVVELDLASEFGSFDDIENNDAAMDSRYLKDHLKGNERDYKSLENGAINNPINHTTVRLANNSDLPDNNNALSAETESLTYYHCHTPKPRKDIRARNQLIIVTILCAIFIVAEVLGKIIHAFTDLI